MLHDSSTQICSNCGKKVRFFGTEDFSNWCRACTDDYNKSIEKLKKRYSELNL